MALRWHVAALAVTVLSGCSDEHDPSALKREPPATSAPSATGAGDVAPPPEEAFDYAADLALLPFDVRLAKVARVAGVPPEDPALDALRARRFDLGDHDYSKGQKPDLSWSASRMATWVKALRPVCASPAMRARFPVLPDRLDDLVLAAYGREALAEDHAAVSEAVAAAALDSESQYQIVCLAILSSLEFVAR